MLRNITAILVISIFLIGVVIAKVTGSSKTGSEFVTDSLTILTKPLMWPVERQLKKLEKLNLQTSSSTSN